MRRRRRRKLRRVRRYFRKKRRRERRYRRRRRRTLRIRRGRRGRRRRRRPRKRRRSKAFAFWLDKLVLHCYLQNPFDLGIGYDIEIMRFAVTITSCLFVSASEHSGGIPCIKVPLKPALCLKKVRPFRILTNFIAIFDCKDCLEKPLHS